MIDLFDWFGLIECVPVALEEHLKKMDTIFFLFIYFIIIIFLVHMVGNMVLGGTQDTKKSQPLAPTKEALSLRAYTAKRKMARLRRCACLLYQSEPLGYIIRKIEAEVENGRLAIRPDKKLHADLGWFIQIK